MNKDIKIKIFKLKVPNLLFENNVQKDTKKSGTKA